MANVAEMKIHLALVALFEVLAIPRERVSYEGRPFTPPDDDGLWYSLTNLPAGREPVSLGDAGQDSYEGVFQVNVHAPQGKGVNAVVNGAGAITHVFKAGASSTVEGQAVLIRRSEISPARRDGVRLVVSVSIYWTSRINR